MRKATCCATKTARLQRLSERAAGGGGARVPQNGAGPAMAIHKFDFIGFPMYVTLQLSLPHNSVRGVSLVWLGHDRDRPP